MIVVARNWDTGELEERDVDPAQPNTTKINGERYFLSEEMVAARLEEWEVGAQESAAEAALAVNEAAICNHLDAEIVAIKQFRQSGATWTSLSNNQKDTLIARLLRDLEYALRLIRRKLNET